MGTWLKNLLAVRQTIAGPRPAKRFFPLTVVLGLGVALAAFLAWFGIGNARPVHAFDTPPQRLERFTLETDLQRASQHHLLLVWVVSNTATLANCPDLRLDATRTAAPNAPVAMANQAPFKRAKPTRAMPHRYVASVPALHLPSDSFELTLHISSAQCQLQQVVTLPVHHQLLEIREPFLARR